MFKINFTPCSSVSIANFEHVIAGWYMKRGCLRDIWRPSFLLRLIFNWRTFSWRVTARWLLG